MPGRFFAGWHSMVLKPSMRSSHCTFRPIVNYAGKKDFGHAGSKPDLRLSTWRGSFGITCMIHRRNFRGVGFLSRPTVVLWDMKSERLRDWALAKRLLFHERCKARYFFIASEYSTWLKICSASATQAPLDHPLNPCVICAMLAFTCSPSRRACAMMK